MTSLVRQRRATADTLELDQIRDLIWYIQQEEFISRYLVIIISSVGVLGSVLLALGLMGKRFLRNTSGVLILITSVVDAVAVLTTLMPYMTGMSVAYYRAPGRNATRCWIWDTWRGLVYALSTWSLMLANLDRVPRTLPSTRPLLARYKHVSRARLVIAWVVMATTLTAVYAAVLWLDVIPAHADVLQEDDCRRCMTGHKRSNAAIIRSWNPAVNSSCPPEPLWRDLTQPLSMMSFLIEHLIPYVTIATCCVVLAVHYKTYKEEHERQCVIMASKKKTELALRVARFNAVYFNGEMEGNGETNKALELKHDVTIHIDKDVSDCEAEEQHTEKEENGAKPTEASDEQEDNKANMGIPNISIEPSSDDEGASQAAAKNDVTKPELKRKQTSFRVPSEDELSGAEMNLPSDNIPEEQEPEMDDHPSLTSMTIAVDILYLLTSLPFPIYALASGVFGAEEHTLDGTGAYLMWLALVEWLQMAPFTLKYFFYYKHGAEYRNALKWLMCRNAHPHAARIVSRSTWTTRHSEIHDTSQASEQEDAVDTGI